MPDDGRILVPATSSDAAIKSVERYCPDILTQAEVQRILKVRNVFVLWTTSPVLTVEAADPTISEMNDTVVRAIWQDVEKRECGCWTFASSAVCNVVRLLAELEQIPLPMGKKLYRMPNCVLGKMCVNPQHVGTSEQYIRQIDPRNETIQTTFTADDVRLLREMKISLL